MIQAVKERVTIQPGGRIELKQLDLPTGAEAEVIVIVEIPTSSESVSSEADQEPINAGQPPDYRDLLQVPDADEADRWSWDWVGPDQDLQPRILPREPGGEAWRLAV